MDAGQTLRLCNPLGEEMLADYFKGDGVRVLTVVVALSFSIPYLGVELRSLRVFI